jgi:hypothetical protein
VRLLAFLTFLFVALVPALAFGQSITIGAVDQFVHSVDTDSTTLSEIWFEECETEGATIEIPITLSGVSDDNIHVFVSKNVDCSNDNERDEAINNGTCIDLGGISDDNAVKLNVRDILRPLAAKDVGVDSPDFCTSVGDGGAVSTKVHLLDLAGGTADTKAEQSFSVDFTGPDPPELERVGVGENQLIVHWDASDSDDIDGYTVFCEPLVDGSLVGEGGTDGESAMPNCAGVLLKEGERPPGSVRGSQQYGVTKNSGAYDNLQNGVWYACGVAGVDRRGNTGNLSAIACSRPEPVTDFYEAYVEAGGEGGGGFCVFSRAPHRSALGLVVGAALLLAARRRKGVRS